MAWTALRTWVAGETVTAAEFNSNLRDDLGLVTGPSAADGRAAAAIWTGSTTNPVIGNGSLVSLIRQDNKWIDWTVIITMGTTTTFGSGTWQLVLPSTARNGVVLADVRGYDNSVSATLGWTLTADANTTIVSLRCLPTTAGTVQDRVVSSANPFTWANLDQLEASFRLEAA